MLAALLDHNHHLIRVAQRLLAMAAAIWHDWEVGVTTTAETHGLSAWRSRNGMVLARV